MNSPPDAPRSRLARLAAAAALVVGLAAVAAWLAIAAGHLRDRYGLNHASGEWIGLAYYAKSGTLYPPLYQDGYYGGTRYGPVPILLHAGGYALTGDPILSGKLVGLLGLGLTLAAGAVLLRRAGASAGLAAAAAGVVVVTDVGWAAGTSVNADGLAVGTQLLALVAATWSRRWTGPAAAGLLCAAAFFVKPSAIWATLSLTAYYALSDRRSLPPFLVAGAAGGLALLGLFQWASGGRMLENFSALLFAGESAGDAAGRMATAARNVCYGMRDYAGEAWVLAPAALAGLAVAAGRPSPVQVSVLGCGAVTAFMFTNPGVSTNHLLDLTVLLTLAAAEFAAWVRVGPDDHAGGANPVRVAGAEPSVPRFLGARASGPQRPGRPRSTDPRGIEDSAPATQIGPGRSAGGVVSAGLVLALAGIVAAGLLVGGSAGEVHRAVREGPAGGLDPDSWRAVFAPGEVVLSCDASIPVLMGQRPVILNAFMLKRVADADPAARAALVRRIDAREFDGVVSAADLRGTLEGDKPLAETDWGAEVVDALERNYERHGPMWGYYVVYKRRPAGAATGGWERWPR